jgi:hypothetical protein
VAAAVAAVVVPEAQLQPLAESGSPEGRVEKAAMASQK